MVLRPKQRGTTAPKARIWNELELQNKNPIFYVRVLLKPSLSFLRLLTETRQWILGKPQGATVISLRDISDHRSGISATIIDMAADHVTRH